MEWYQLFFTSTKLKRPYVGKSRKEIKEKIMAKQVQIKKSEIPEGWSIEAADFINRVLFKFLLFKLLQRKPANRLGLHGAQELKDHAWLKYFFWKDLYLKKLDSPFIPRSGDNFDSKYCNAPDKIGLNTKERYNHILKDECYKIVFKEFYYLNKEKDDNDPESIANKFNNPHAVYLQNSIVVLKSDGESTNKDSYTNIISKVNEDKLLNLKKMSISQSTTAFLKTSRQEPPVSYNTPIMYSLNKNIMNNISAGGTGISGIPGMSSSTSNSTVYETNMNKFMSRRSSSKTSFNY